MDHKLKAAKVKPAVEVDDIAGPEGEIAAADGFGSEADVLGFSPAFLWDEAFGDEFVVLVFYATGHVGGHDAGAKLDDLDAFGGEAGSPELGGHGETGFGDTVFPAVDRGGVGGDRGDEDQFIATWEKGFSWVSEPVSGGELGEEVGALEIHAKDLVEDFHFGVWEIGAFAGGDACIVDQGIEATESFENPLD